MSLTQDIQIQPIQTVPSLPSALTGTDLVLVTRSGTAYTAPATSLATPANGAVTEAMLATALATKINNKYDSNSTIDGETYS
jgi:hypothetical protein